MKPRFFFIAGGLLLLGLAGTMPAQEAAQQPPPDTAKTSAPAPEKLVLKEGSDVNLKFAQDLKQNDDLLAWRPLLREAEGETEAGEMQQIASDSYISTESNLYAISPATSHVSKEFAAGDPDFWSSRPAANVKPEANGPENADRQKSAKPKSVP